MTSNDALMLANLREPYPHSRQSLLSLDDGLLRG